MQRANIRYLLSTKLETSRPLTFRMLTDKLCDETKDNGLPSLELILDATILFMKYARPSSMTPPFTIFNEPMPSWNQERYLLSEPAKECASHQGVTGTKIGNWHSLCSQNLTESESRCFRSGKTENEKLPNHILAVIIYHNFPSTDCGNRFFVTLLVLAFCRPIMLVWQAASTITVEITHFRVGEITRGCGWNNTDYFIASFGILWSVYFDLYWHVNQEKLSMRKFSVFLFGNECLFICPTRFHYTTGAPAYWKREPCSAGTGTTTSIGVSTGTGIGTGGGINETVAAHKSIAAFLEPIKRPFIRGSGAYSR